MIFCMCRSELYKIGHQILHILWVILWITEVSTSSVFFCDIEPWKIGNKWIGEPVISEHTCGFLVHPLLWNDLRTVETPEEANFFNLFE